jgi:hypothetical protein
VPVVNSPAKPAAAASRQGRPQDDEDLLTPVAVLVAQRRLAVPGEGGDDLLVEDREILRKLGEGAAPGVVVPCFYGG